jgi:hypothetical protein
LRLRQGSTCDEIEGDSAMKILLTGIISALVLCGCSLLAQDPTPQPNSAVPQEQQGPAPPRSTQSSEEQASSSPRIAPGSVIAVLLTKSIDARKVKSGDEVEARVTQDMKIGNGEVVVLKNTKVVGHITKAQARSKEQKESQVGVAFDHVVMKDGGDMTLPMTIQAIIAPPNWNPENNNTDSESARQPVSAPSAGGAPGNSGGRSVGMGPTAPQPAPNAPAVSVGEPSSSQTGVNTRPPITGNTQGVVGISNLELSAAGSTAQGSIISSEKNNVKLEGGTLMLLRVNP